MPLPPKEEAKKSTSYWAQAKYPTTKVRSICLRRPTPSREIASSFHFLAKTNPASSFGGSGGNADDRGRTVESAAVALLPRNDNAPYDTAQGFLSVFHFNAEFFNTGFIFVASFGKVKYIFLYLVAVGKSNPTQIFKMIRFAGVYSAVKRRGDLHARG